MEVLFEKLASYGGVAGVVAAILLYWAYKQSERMAKTLDDDRKLLIELVANNTVAVNNITVALNQRPCIKGEIKDAPHA